MNSAKTVHNAKLRIHIVPVLCADAANWAARRGGSSILGRLSFAHTVPVASRWCPVPGRDVVALLNCVPTDPLQIVRKRIKYGTKGQHFREKRDEPHRGSDEMHLIECGAGALAREKPACLFDSDIRINTRSEVP